MPITNRGRILELVSRLGTSGTPGSSVSIGVPYQSLPFDALADIASQKGAQVASEYGVIERHIPERFATVLDIGANVGFHSFMLSRKPGVVRVDAVDADPDNRALMAELAAQSGECVFAHSAIPDDAHWDVCVMLNVHHWIENKIGYEGTRLLMQTLSQRVGTIFFQTAHQESRAHVLSALRNEAGIGSYLEECGWGCVRSLGSTQPGPPRFLFTAIGAVN